MNKLCLIIIFYIPFFSLSQDIQTFEKDLLNHLNRIDNFGYLSLKTDENTYDSLVAENQIFRNKIIKYALKNPEILLYNFPLLKKNNLYIATSEDKKFRIFSWDLQTGGTMRFFDNIFIYEQYGKVYEHTITKEEGSAGGFYSEIFQVTDELNTFYIAYFHSILSTRDCYQAVHVFDFEKNNFNEKFKKIKTKSGYINTLGFSFNFFSVVDRKERPVKLIHFNKTLQTISIPLVKENGSVTSKKIVYKYDGDYFIINVSKK